MPRRLRRPNDDAQFIPLPVVRPERAAMTGEAGLINALAAILPKDSRAGGRSVSSPARRCCVRQKVHRLSIPWPRR